MTELLSANGLNPECIPTTGQGAATEIARKAVEEGAGLILAAGGDGTINEVVNGMAHSDVPLGILPCGTANVLANELGFGNNVERAAQGLCECVPERVPLGLLQTTPPVAPRYFLMMAGVGLDAEIVFHIDSKLKNLIGKGAYWIGGLRRLGRRIPEFTIECDGRTYRAGFALASRVRNYGGDLEIARDVSLLDDQFELVLFEGSSSLTFLRYFSGVALRRHHRMRGITILRTTAASFSSIPEPRIHVQVDGEYAGLLPARVEIVPSALTLAVPPDLRVRRPVPVEESAWITSPTR